MPRVLKITGIVLGSLVGLVLLAIAILLLVIDPNDYKPQLTALVKEKTDMTLAIDDRLEWTLWPSIGLRLGKVSLSDTDAKETLVAVDKAGVSVALMPLFSQRIEIDAVSMDGARLRYIQYADGRSSWSRMLDKLESESKKPEEEKEKEKATEPVAFSMEKLEVKNSSLYLKDEKAGVERALQDVGLTATDIGMKEAFPVKLQFTFSQKDAEGKTLLAENVLETSATLDPEKELYEFAQLAFTSALSGTSLPAPITVDLRAGVKADMAAQKVSVSGLKLDTTYADPKLKSPATIGLTADVQADLAQTQANVDKLQMRITWPDASRPQPVSAALAGTIAANWGSGELDASSLAMNALLPAAGYPKPLQASLKLPVKGNWKQGNFSLPQIVLDVAGMHLQGAVEAKLPAMQSTEPDTPITRGMALSGNLSAAPFNPRALMAALGIEAPKTRDANVLKRTSLTTQIEGDEKKILLRNLRLTLDETTLSGDAGISDLETMRQYARLSLDRMDVDRYMAPEPPAAPASAQTTPPAAQPQASKDVLPVDTLKGLNFDVALSAGSLKLMDYPVTGFRVAATAGNGNVSVSEFKGGIFKGGFSAPLSINVQGKQPVLKLQPRLDAMEIGPLARKLLRKDLLEGRASYNGVLTLQGNSTEAWMRSVSGTSDLKLENGVLHGVNAMKELNEALGKYQSLLALAGKDLGAEAEKQRDTEIANFSAINTLDKGVVNSKSLDADLKKAKVAGSGNFNLVTQELDYRFNLNLDKSVAGDRYAAYALPVQCKGSLAGNLATLCKLDSKAVADMALKAATAKGLEKLGLKGDTAQEAVKNKAAEEKAKAKEKAKEKLNEELNKLFRR